MDYGGAINNCGTLKCYNCMFTNNLASYGGAIITNGTYSSCSLENCYFDGMLHIKMVIMHFGGCINGLVVIS